MLVASLRPAPAGAASVATLSGVTDEWVTQLLRRGDANVFKKYSQMKVRMKREAQQKLNRVANGGGVCDGRDHGDGFCASFATLRDGAIRMPLEDAVKSRVSRVGA